jgi:Spy/CpxP family protein refolding chaperone
MPNARGFDGTWFDTSQSVAKSQVEGGVLMTRRIPTLIAAISLVVISGTASADERGMTDSRQPGDLQSQWEQIVSRNMDLSDSERAQFGPLYHEYRGAVAKIDDRLFDLLRTYAESYRSLDDTQARQLLKDYVEQRADRVKLDQTYIPRFQEVMSPKDVVRLFQIENKLRAKVSAYFAERVPLAAGDSENVTSATGATETPSGSSGER